MFFIDLITGLAEFFEAQFRGAILNVPLENPLSILYVIINFVLQLSAGGFGGVL